MAKINQRDKNRNYHGFHYKNGLKGNFVNGMPEGCFNSNYWKANFKNGKPIGVKLLYSVYQHFYKQGKQFGEVLEKD